jgi:hypothetical protein
MAYDINDPKDSGLLNAALTMLALSGPRSQRSTFGSILGQSGLAGMGEYNAARVLQQRDEELARRNRLVDMQTRKMEQDILNEQQMDKWVSDPTNLLKMQQPQSALGDYGPGEAPTLGPQETTMQPKGGRELAMSMLRSGNPLLAKMGFSQLAKAEPSGLMTVGNNIFDPNTRQFITPPTQAKQTDEKDMFIRRMVAAGIDPESPEGRALLKRRLERDVTVPSNEQLSIKVEAQQRGKERVSDNLLRIRDAFEYLEEAGGAIKTDGGVVNNTINRVMSSDPGQIVGQALGTRSQKARDDIAMLRPLLIQEIRQATGMSARAMDSNVELKFYLSAATDPTRNIDSNYAAIEHLDKVFGLGIGIKARNPSSADALRKEFGDSGAANPIAPQGGLTRGQVVDGYMYLGGDPKNPSSWAKTP